MRSDKFSQQTNISTYNSKQKMSAIESIKLHLNPTHLRKLGKGVNVQLSHDQLHSALHGEPSAELEMAKKHITALLRAHRSGKGYRLMHNKIHGGKLNLKNIGRQIVHSAKKVMSNPVVKKVAKELGHLAVGVANNYAAQNGMDTSAYANIANKAIESKNVKQEIQQQIGNDIMNYAHAQAGGKIKIPKGLKDFGNGFVKGITTVAKNPIAQGVATNLITGALMGVGVKKRRGAAKSGGKLVKGSAEAKAHMARLRAARSGGALFPSCMGVKKNMKPLKFEK
jgi:hypothetical protein